MVLQCTSNHLLLCRRSDRRNAVYFQFISSFQIGKPDAATQAILQIFRNDPNTTRSQ